MPSTYKADEQLPLSIEGWPWCAVCNKPVDKVVFAKDISVLAEHIRVYCHGAHEDVLVSYFQIEIGEKFSIGGRAFETKQLA